MDKISDISWSHKNNFILPMVSELVSTQKVLGVQCETEDGKEDVVE